MKKNIKQLLIAIKSILELGENLSLLQFFISRLPEMYNKKFIVDELKRQNYGEALILIDSALYDLETNGVQFEIEDL